jgi:hypothetical protein
MGFLDDGTVPSGKRYLHPLAANDDPDQYVTDDEWNGLMQDILDLRTGLIAADQFAFTPQSSMPAAHSDGGQIYRLWVKTSDKTLHYYDGTTDHDITAGGGGSGNATLAKQRYTVTGSEGTDFMVTLSVAQSDDLYAVIPLQVKGTAAVFIECPDDSGGDRTTTQFRVLLSAGLTSGDKIDFLVIR